MSVFVLSKLFWAAVQPSNLLLVLVVVAALAGVLGRHRLAVWTGCLAAGVLFLVTGLPLGEWLAVPLENRFPPVTEPPARVDGVIALGGGIDAEVASARGQFTVNDSAERFIALAGLGARHPDARLVYTGGSGRLFPGATTGADVIPWLLEALGLAPDRLIIEGRSRNTYENALFTQELVQPRPGERWLLVTSAAHMPRAVGVFRKVGWEVTAYPVDFRTTGRLELKPAFEVSRRLAELDRAVYSWVGMIVYRLLGRTDALFPAPEPDGG